MQQFISQPAVQKSNQFIASLTELAGRFLIEQKYFQNNAIPTTTLIYLANDLITVLNEEEENKKEKMSLAKELTISYKQLTGKALTKEEEKYDNEIHELDVTQEIFNGIKYATSFSIFKNLYHSVSSAVSQNLSEHIPAIIGSTAALTVAPYLLSNAIEKVLSKSNLNSEQKAMIKPWLNTVGRLALAFTPKVEANEQGVQYQYPSTEGHKELYKNINLTITPNTKNLLGDKPNIEIPKNIMEFKLKRIQLGENNSIELIAADKNNEELKFDFSFMNTALSYAPDYYSISKFAIALGTQKILLKHSPPLLPLFLMPSLFSSSVKAQGVGAVGKEFLVNTNVANEQGFYPKIAKLNDGGFVSVWSSLGQDGAGYGVYGKRYSANGNELASPTSGLNTASGNEFKINVYTANDQYYPAVSALNDGGFVVLWVSNAQDGSGYGIYGLRFAANGSEVSVPSSGLNTAIGKEFRINAYTVTNQYSFSISALSDGGFVVVWMSNGQDGSLNGIYGLRFAANGAEITLPSSGINTALGNEFKINAYTNNSQGNPVVSALNDGGFVVVWESDNQDGSNYGIYGLRFAVNGTEISLPSSGNNTALGKEFKINAYTVGQQWHLAVSALNDGGFVVVWESSNQDGYSYGIYGLRFAANGAEVSVPSSGLNTALGNEFKINTYTANQQEYPAVSALNDGGFVVVWQSNSQDGSSYGVYGLRFAANGAEVSLPSSGNNTALGNEFRINAFINNLQDSPAVSSLSDGGFVVVWQSGYNSTAGQDGSSYGVYGLRFAANGAEIALQLPTQSTTMATTQSTSSTNLPTASITQNPTTTSLSSTSIPVTTQPVTDPQSTNNIPLIAGIVGGVVMVSCLGTGTFFIVKKLNAKKQNKAITTTEIGEDNEKNTMELKAKHVESHPKQEDNDFSKSYDRVPHYDRVSSNEYDKVPHYDRVSSNEYARHSQPELESSVTISPNDSFFKKESVDSSSERNRTDDNDKNMNYVFPRKK